MAVWTHSPRHTRSKSEGMLIDFDEHPPTNSIFLKDNSYQEISNGQETDLLKDWNEMLFQPPKPVGSGSTNPFWNGLSGSNPFLDDIVNASNRKKTDSVFEFIKDQQQLFNTPKPTESVASSTDELDIDHLIHIGKPFAKKHGRWKSASDILDFSNKEEGVTQNNRPVSQFLVPNLDSLQNDREAHKIAWLNHRQLTRSCLDLDMSQSPGWGQTQATETQIVCKLDHNGGCLQLPESDISIHVPEGHVAPGEIQEVAAKIVLDPPQELNDYLCTTISPLLELKLSNFNTKEFISLEMKVTAQVKNDPLSQIMTEIVCFCSDNKEGPFEKLHSIYVYKNIIQVKLEHLNPSMYIVAAAEAKHIQLPALTVWDYIDKMVTIGIYGPKHIHPTFTAVCTVFGHNQVPLKLSVTDVKKNRSLPPVVLQLWGKHEFHLQRPQKLEISIVPTDATYEIQKDDQYKYIKEASLKMGRTVHQQFPLSTSRLGEVDPFELQIQITGTDQSVVSHFTVLTPLPTVKSNVKRRFQKRKEQLTASPSPEPSTIKYPQFQERNVNILSYGVSLKTVLRQPKIEYLLEYFKGDTIALLGLDKVKVVGQTKIKEWYVGFLRGKIGLVHCKNIKVISKDQVINFSDVTITTKLLLEQITLPFKKLTYMYSSIRTIVTENVVSWKAFAEVVGYSSLSLDDFCRTNVDSELERVASVLEKLKEDCHASDKVKKKFQHEIITGLLKLDCQGPITRLIQDVVMLSVAVELGIRWRELAEKMSMLSKQQIDAYEVPHRNKYGEISEETMWKPAYDFLYAWSMQFGDGYRDVLQELQNALDKMKNPITRHWRHLTGVLILVNCMEILRASAFCKHEE
ncbi:metastasis-associated in colon cancer protein 1 [Callorhinchus milii]|uniref:metastasis-associated in colon cancer protein 1 n=1 Tax=Callorhinchus milii TaxID=7868 RepID=UPI001C3FEBA4|nr:metastasis-associated in colon cancer protein 1 [Callorhinchus milii]